MKKSKNITHSFITPEIVIDNFFRPFVWHCYREDFTEAELAQLFDAVGTVIDNTTMPPDFFTTVSFNINTTLVTEIARLFDKTPLPEIMDNYTLVLDTPLDGVYVHQGTLEELLATIQDYAAQNEVDSTLFGALVQKIGALTAQSLAAIAAIALEFPAHAVLVERTALLPFLQAVRYALNEHMNAHYSNWKADNFLPAHEVRAEKIANKKKELQDLFTRAMVMVMGVSSHNINVVSHHLSWRATAALSAYSHPY